MLPRRVRDTTVSFLTVATEIYRGATVDRRRSDVYSLHTSMIDYTFDLSCFFREVGSLAMSRKRLYAPS